MVRLSKYGSAMRQAEASARRPRQLQEYPAEWDEDSVDDMIREDVEKEVFDTVMKDPDEMLEMLNQVGYAEHYNSLCYCLVSVMDSTTDLAVHGRHLKNVIREFAEEYAQNEAQTAVEDVDNSRWITNDLEDDRY